MRIEQVEEKIFSFHIDNVYENVEKVKEWIDKNIEENQFYEIDDDIEVCCETVTIKIFEKF